MTRLRLFAFTLDKFSLVAGNFTGVVGPVSIAAAVFKEDNVVC